jgi:hypothetical protein
MNSNRIILDLCGGTGAWSKPYADAGYDVRLVTLPEHDVRLYECPTEPIHGILAAPPCTYFCRARMCRGRPTDEQFKEALTVVDACLRIILMCRPKWWAVENPQGYLRRWLGEPRHKFEPWHYGDAWTKRTWLWGNFTLSFQKHALIKSEQSEGNRGAQCRSSFYHPARLRPGVFRGKPIRRPLTWTSQSPWPWPSCWPWA